MSIAGSQYSVDGTAVKLAESNGMPLEVHIHCASGSIYLGNSAVTTATGYRMDNGDKLTMQLSDNESLYAVTAGSTVTMMVMATIN